MSLLYVESRQGQRSESFMRRLKRRVEGEVLESEVVTGKRGDSEKV
jgi:hypothetical protein